MPELPEVETVRRGLWPRVKEFEIERVDLYRSGLRTEFTPNFAASLEKRRLIDLQRRGKYLAFGLSDGAHMIAHLGMSGSFRLENQPLMSTHFGQNHRDKHHHVRFWLRKDSKSLWLDYHDPRRFGFLLYRPPGTLSDTPPWSQLGIEPLTENFANDKLYQRLISLKMTIKSALMRQDLIAGLGNIYVLEALFLAQISPFRLASSLTRSDFLTLTNHIQTLLLASIEKGGSSLKDHRSVEGEIGHFQDGFFVYGRSGQNCLRPRCKGQVERLIDHGRSSFYCPQCQKSPQKLT